MTTAIQNGLVTRLPVSALFISALNVRKTDTERGIEELAASIEADGVIENLVTVPEFKTEGELSGRQGVVVGGRRCRALHRLLAQGRISPDYLVNCLVVDEKRAIKLSLAENVNREGMHPADEFEAFRVLIDLGYPIEDVAAHFGVTPPVVERRLKLANVHPELVDLYRKGESDLEQLMALAVVDDQERQKNVWDSLRKHDRDPSTLRHRLTEKEISSFDRRAKFVGIAAYKKAGGALRQDLFSDEGEQFLIDVALLEKLMTEKLERKAAKLKKEGCAWVEVMPSVTYPDRARYGRVRSIQRQATEAEQAELEALSAKHKELSSQLEAAEDDDELYESLDAELEEVDSRQEELREAMSELDPAQLALAGAIVYVNNAGQVEVADNLLRPEDAKNFATAEDDEDGIGQPKAPRIHSAALMRKLTAQRTLALRAELSAQPSVALVALTHALALNAFYPHTSRLSALDVRCAESRLNAHDPQLETSEAYVQLEEQRAALRGTLPEEGEQLLAWLLARPQAEVLELLAFCVGRSVDAVQSEEDPHAADALASAAAVDMRRWWKPTATGYFGSVSRARILEVSREFIAPEVLAKFEKLKKGELAQAAEAQLATTGWLPERLRLPAAAA